MWGCRPRARAWAVDRRRAADSSQRWLASWCARAFGASLWLALPASGSAAPEATSSVEFRWDAPEQACPDEPTVTAELERLLGGPVAEQGRGRLVAIARVRQSDGAWDLRLWTVTDLETRQRSLTGEDCEVLAEAAALLAAMAIDPDVLTRGAASHDAVQQAETARDVAADETSAPVETVPEPAPDPPAPDPPAPNPPVPDPPAPDPPAPDPPAPDPSPLARRPTIAVGAQGGASLADLPGIGPAVRAHVAAQWTRLRVGIALHYAFVRRARRQGDRERGADLRHATAILRACGVLRYRPAKLEFPLCGGLEGGAIVGTGVGFPTVADGAVPWIAVDLAPALVWAPLPRLAVGLSIEPWLALLRGRLLVDDGSELWRPRWVGVRALAGLEARF